MLSLEGAKELLRNFCSEKRLSVSDGFYKNTFNIGSFKWKEVQFDTTPSGRIKIVLVSLAVSSVTQEITVSTPEEMYDFLTAHIPRRKIKLFAECITELHSRIVELERCL